jgi:hypothetical protein
MRDLEQLIGQNIIWVGGDSFETVIKKHGNFIPNMGTRFCTTDMKIRPIAEYIYKNIISDNEKVFSNIGIRYDEKERAKYGKKERELKTKIIIGKNGTRNKWKDLNWGIANYPLVYDKVTHIPVHKFWESKKIKFPDDSNCVGCFWKNIQQLRKNYDDNYNKMEWFNNMEINSKYNYKSNITYEQIKKDITNYLPLLKTNCLIGGHDYHVNWSGVVKGINELLGDPDTTFSDTSWIKLIK